MRRLLIPVAVLVVMCLAVPSAHALDMVVSVPVEITAGERARFTLHAHNGSSEAVRVDLPEHTTCLFVSGDLSLTAEARAVSPEAGTVVRLAPGGFASVTYMAAVPLELSGPVRLELPDIGAPPVLFAAVPPGEPGEAVAKATDDEKDRDGFRYDSMDALFSLYQPYLANIGPYKPMYFLAGIEPAESKFQISLKYQFFSGDNPLAQRHPWVEGFHFGYTQTSFWDLEASSAPFRDTSYKPELFYLSSNLTPWPDHLTGLFLQAGLQHESNGRAGEASRSTNFAYFQPMFLFYHKATKLGIMAAPRVQGYVDNDRTTNRDLDEYRGHFGLELKAGKADSVVAGVELAYAEQGASVRVDVTYPLHRLLYRNFDLYFHGQYSNALAESLLEYTERNETFRLGFSIVR
ncbi:MAG: phospholipase A [Desulfatibacillaceae bacterium]